MRSYCARCGKQLIPGSSVGPFCLDCYVEMYKLLCVPEQVSFDYCKYCGAYRLGHRWQSGGELEEAVQLFIEEVARNVKPCRPEVKSFSVESVEPLTQPSWRTIYAIRYSIQIQGVDKPVFQTYRVEVRANPTICPTCKDIRGGEYNVLLQVRGIKPTELARLLRPLLDSSEQIQNSIVDIIEYSNGVDFLLLD